MTRPVTQIILAISLLGDIFITTILLFVGLVAENPAFMAAALFTIGGILEKPDLLHGYRIKNYPAVHGLGRKYAVILLFLSRFFLIVTGFLLTTTILRLLADGYTLTVTLSTLIAAYSVFFLKSILLRKTVLAAQKIKIRFLYTEVWSQRNGLLILAATCVAVTAGRIGYPIAHGLASLLISVLVIRLGIGLRQGNP
ncbi:MAG: hypothetical protein KGZ63_08000 [Clostridiales bacterium]|jgi:divalent metal cation (Fe/Co/Zn/Cd) transporter|nr:hypothetical protein [Clostridiales bacterium]